MFQNSKVILSVGIKLATVLYKGGYDMHVLRCSKGLWVQRNSLDLNSRLQNSGIYNLKILDVVPKQSKGTSESLRACNNQTMRNCSSNYCIHTSLMICLQLLSLKLDHVYWLRNESCFQIKALTMFTMS